MRLEEYIKKLPILFARVLKLENRTSTFSDYSKVSVGVLPTTTTKLDYSGATLIHGSESLFDPVNSRILKMPLNSVGKALVSMTIDSSGGNNWVELTAVAFNNVGVELFAKTPITIPLVKNLAEDAISQNLSFYFGMGVEYFEIHIKASSGLPYSNPSITVIKY